MKILLIVVLRMSSQAMAGLIYDFKSDLSTLRTDW